MMIGRYKKKILQMTGLLRQLEGNPADLEALVMIQGVLIRLVTITEGNIARVREHARANTVKLKGSRLPKDETRILRKDIQKYRKRVADYQYLKFIWKCFGDGIAFIYLDKFSLKHTFYDTHDYVPKQDAGALSGKTGLKQEWAFVKMFKDNDIPALLCDLTNTLRHGDVCVLVGPDPILIEVKSSKHANDRVERQVQSIKSLNRFFENDEARNFRGVPHVSRVEFSPPEITHVDALSRCIENSEGKAAFVVTPEPGLHYLCLRETGGLGELLAGTINSDTTVSILNEAKRDQSWPPYFPFTLSIRNPIHLYEFIRGDFTLAVAVDCAELRRQFLSRGHEFVLSQDENWAIWMRGTGEEGASAISRQMFGRLFHEFQSLAWFVTVQSDYGKKIESVLKKQPALVKDGTETLESGWIGEVPEHVQHLFENQRATATTLRPISPIGSKPARKTQSR
jgi:hypothetical protein